MGNKIVRLQKFGEKNKLVRVGVRIDLQSAKLAEVISCDTL